MSQVTILGVSQDKLLENTQAALEGFQNGRPVKRDALVRKALATILGQSNEHLPTAKFADDNANIESRERREVIGAVKHALRLLPLFFP